MALAAINSGQGELDISNTTLSIRPDFFSASNLERMQATAYVPCELPAELPPLPKLKMRRQAGSTPPDASSLPKASQHTEPSQQKLMPTASQRLQHFSNEVS